MTDLQVYVAARNANTSASRIVLNYCGEKTLKS